MNDEKKRHYVTYFDRNYLVKGIALINSLRRHENRNFELFVVCMDELTRSLLDKLDFEQVTTVPLHSIERCDEPLVEARAKRTLVEYYWTLTPTIALRILERHPRIEVLTYLDADLFFYSSPDPIFEELGDNSILIHEHRYSAECAHLATNGTYNVGLMSFRNDPRGLTALRWWRERCNEWCFNRFENGKKGDQSYLEDWPSRFEGVRVLEHIGAGVGPWNHQQYRLRGERDGSVRVDNCALVFYHFHALTMVSPDLVMPTGYNFQLNEDVLRYVVVPYVDALRDATSRLLEQMPQFRFGILNEGVFNAQQSFIATPDMASMIEASGAPQKRFELTKHWDGYASEQLVRPAPAAEPRAAALQQPLSPSSDSPLAGPCGAPSPAAIAREVVHTHLSRAGVLAPLQAATHKAEEVLQSLFGDKGRDAIVVARAALLELLADELERDDPPLAPAFDTKATAEPSVSQIQELAELVKRRMEIGSLEEAREAAAELLQLLPDNADTIITVANLDVQLGNLVAAEKQLVRAGFTLYDDPAAQRDLAVSLVALGRRFRESGNAAVAGINFERALRADATCQSALQELGRTTTPEPAPAPRAEEPLVSVVVLAYNQLQDTIKCLESIEQHTSSPYELIVVDNASSDGTVDYLRSWAADRSHVKVVANRDNLGFAGGNNLGMALSTGAYVVVLNNDTIVTDGWLRGMVDVYRRNPTAALVGPRSNYVAGAQLVHEVGYDDDEGLHVFAKEWAAANQGQDQEAYRLVGFCMMICRSVIKQIGGLDTRYGRGNFEDDDFCLRTQAKGYTAHIAHEVFIHHEGHKTFTGNNIDYNEALHENFEIFKRKWAVDPAWSLKQGFPNKIKAPDSALATIALPDLAAEHTASMDGRWWQQADAPRLEQAADPPPAPAAQTPAPQRSGLSRLSTARIEHDDGFFEQPTNSAKAAQADETTRRDELFDQAEHAAATNDWPAAFQLFSQITEDWPDFSAAFVGLASSAFAKGEVLLGADALDRACELEPENMPLLMQRGLSFAHAGLAERAQSALVTVLKLEPDNLDALLSLSQLCRATRNFVEAADLLDHANTVYPDEPDVVVAVGALAADLGDAQAANRALVNLKRLAPRHPELDALQRAVAQAS